MPIENAVQTVAHACQSAISFSIQIQSFSAPNKFYRVDWQRNPLSGQGQWTCDCPNFQHRKKMCKHIESVLNGKMRCGWIGANPADKEKCPKCGRPAIPLNPTQV